MLVVDAAKEKKNSMLEDDGHDKHPGTECKRVNVIVFLHRIIEVPKLRHAFCRIRYGPSGGRLAERHDQEVLHEVAGEEANNGSEGYGDDEHEVARDELLQVRGGEHEVVDALLAGLEIGEDAGTTGYDIDQKEHDAEHRHAESRVTDRLENQHDHLRDDEESEECQHHGDDLAFAEQQLPAQHL